MHRVAVVALDGVVAFDLSTPLEILGRVRLPSGRPGYQVRICGLAREVDAGAFKLRLRYGLAEIRQADTIILPGVTDIAQPVPRALIRAVRDASRAGVRIATICSGAFLLAATGLLDGRRATTHWFAARELAHRFPQIEVDPNVLFVDEGNLLTSAGASAGIDMCLHLVQRDYGAAIAAATARLAVMPLQREGGQAQFIEHAPPPTDTSSLSSVLAWIDENLDRDLSLEMVAHRAAMSVRTLSRQFRAQTGTTPLLWLQQARVARAKVLLETTSLSVEHIASSAGFGSVASFRVHFGRIVETTPQAYRRAFQLKQPA